MSQKSSRVAMELTMAMAATLPYVQLDEAKSRVYPGIRMAPKKWTKRKSRLRAAGQSRKANRR